jgi:indole-3-glycerol phosphate synthase
LRMAEKIPVGKIKIAESGISSVKNINLFRQHGFHGFLIGENFMKAPDPAIAFADFINQLKNSSS